MEARLHVAAMAAVNSLSTLNPTGPRHCLPIIEDIAFSDAFQQRMNEMNIYLEEADERHFASMHTTMKICLKLKDQEPHRLSKDIRDTAPFGIDFAWRKLLTIRGRMGAILLLYPLHDESASRIVEALSPTSRRHSWQL